MKHMMLLVPVVLLALASQAQAPAKMTDFQKKDKIYLLEGKPFSGMCYEKYDNGKIGLKGQMKNGMKEGVWTWWYSTGQKKRETTYIDNKKEGMTYYWHQNGQKAKELMFKNDKNIDQKLWDEGGNRLPNPAFSQTMD